MKIDELLYSDLISMEEKKLRENQCMYLVLDGSGYRIRVLSSSFKNLSSDPLTREKSVWVIKREDFFKVIEENPEFVNSFFPNKLLADKQLTQKDVQDYFGIELRPENLTEMKAYTLEEKEELSGQFMQIITSGNVAELKRFIEQGVDLNQLLDDDVSPACLAAAHGHVGVIKVLYECGANLNQPMRQGVTPAFIAARNGRVGVINELHECGASLNQATSDGIAPAHVAAAEGHADVIQTLHTLGIDLNKSDKNGFTPLLFAIQFNQIDVIRYLLKHNLSDETPVRAKASDWQSNVSFCETEVQERMTHFIQSKKQTNDQDEPIDISPTDFAGIMGNNEIIQEMTKTNEITRQFKASLPKNNELDNATNNSPEPPK